MTCDEVRESLSGNLDGELENSVAEQVRGHLATCRACAQESEALSNLTRLLRPLRDCDLRVDLWERISAHVAGAAVQDDPPCPGAGAAWSQPRRRWPWVAAAAAVGVATFISSYQFASRSWFAPEPVRPIQTAYGLALGVYVQEFEEGEQAFDRFLALHEGREVSPDGLVRQVGFTPLVPEELPDGFRLDKSYVLATTCCNAIELRYVKGARLVTVFQQGPGHPVLFDRFDIETTRIAGISCRRGRVGDVVIVNWDGGGRNTTLLARADAPQIESMVRFLNRTH